MVRDNRPKHPRWQPAVVHALEGPKSYRVTLPGGGVPRRRHSDQMVHGPEGVTLDQPSTGEPDEETPRCKHQLTQHCWPQLLNSFRTRDYSQEV